MSQSYDDIAGNLDKILLHEKMLMDKIEKLQLTKELNNARTQKIKSLFAAKKTGHIEDILDMEKRLIRNDLTHHSNSKDMKQSLEKSLNEMRLAERMVEKVRDPARYKETNNDYGKPESRKAGLPYDEARQFFASQKTRLRNNDKSGLDIHSKQVLRERRNNLIIAEKLYIAEQKKALGIGPKKDKSRETGICR